MSRIAVPLSFRTSRRDNRRPARAAEQLNGQVPTPDTTRDAIVVDLFNLLVRLSVVLDEQTAALTKQHRRIDVLEALVGTRSVERKPAAVRSLPSNHCASR